MTVFQADSLAFSILIHRLIY
uniref:Uncharacterized protein n=1 Tax=Arundo donax TaxID=35708 RepID=A0A0A8Z5H2_ARUDO